MLTEHLPESIKELADIIGVNKALSIVALRGGTKLSIPDQAKETHWLVDVIGYESFNDLCYHYSGCEIEIPKCFKTIGLITDREILEDRKNLTMAGLARKYGYTERGIRKVIERAKKQAMENKKPEQ